MKYRRLGKTDLNVSEVGIGSWQFSGAWGKNFEQQEVDQILNRAQELGINLIDTAECYGHHSSEKFIGEAIKHNRDKWIVCTKFGHNRKSDLPSEQHYQPEQVLIQLEASLKALQTDYIDLYQFHSGNKELFDNDDLWTMLDKQKQAGKIRFLGNSIGQPSMLYQVQRSSDFGISVIQTVYNMAKTKAEETVFPVCKNQDLGVLARVPLASGFLTGNYQPGAHFTENDIRSKRPDDGRDQEIKTALELIKACPEGVNPATYAIHWCLQQDQVSCVIPGIKNINQLEVNAAASDLAL